MRPRVYHGATCKACGKWFACKVGADGTCGCTTPKIVIGQDDATAAMAAGFLPSLRTAVDNVKREHDWDELVQWVLLVLANGEATMRVLVARRGADRAREDLYVQDTPACAHRFEIPPDEIKAARSWVRKKKAKK